MLQAAELVSVITAAAVGIAQCRTVEEIEVLATSFAQLGDTLATIAVQRGRQEECLNSQKTSKK